MPEVTSSRNHGAGAPLTDVLRAYLEKMGVDADTFIGMMTRAGPENMYEPDVADLCKPLIATWVQRTCNAETP